MSAYAGVGSRDTPAEVCLMFTELAGLLGKWGWTLRTGGAPGADRAFWYGARGYRRELFLPSPGFWEPPDPAPLMDEVFGNPRPEAYPIAEAAHPAWRNVRPYARDLHARNVHQVLGWTLLDPAAMVVCWTKGGRGGGGTGQAIRLAKARGIPVYDAGNEEARARLASWIDNA